MVVFLETAAVPDPGQQMVVFLETAVPDLGQQMVVFLETAAVPDPG